MAYHRPFSEAKRIQVGEGAKHLECIFYKGKRWYCRLHLGEGDLLSLGFPTEEEAYACWIGATRAKRIKDGPYVRPGEQR